MIPKKRQGAAVPEKPTKKKALSYPVLLVSGFGAPAVLGAQE